MALAAAVTGSDELNPRELLRVLTAFRKGDFTPRMPLDQTGVAGKIADTLNEILDTKQRLVAETQRVRMEAGSEGRTGERVALPGAVGGWRAQADAINGLMDDLIRPTSEMSRVIGEVARGNLAQTVQLEIGGKSLQGDFLQTARTVNTMVEQLNSFAGEVTRVAREVGTEGKLGGQAKVEGVSGTWKDLTDSVNGMASNLTSQVRNIAEVTIAVANGDLSKKITVDVRGEFLQLKDAMNTMVEQLRGFAGEVTRVAREVGTDGKLGGQAVVLGVAGTWKDLTDSVNALVRQLKADPDTRDIRVVAVTCYPEQYPKAAALAAGCDAYLLKPINTRELSGQLTAFAEGGDAVN